MMNYPNPYYQNNIGMPPYPNHFAQAMQQNYAQPQNQQQITTQPPIMTPTTSGSKIIPVSNKEEATGTAVDLVNGTPTFFYNKSNGEIYLKQFDIPTGKGIFKTYIEIPPEIEESKTEQVFHNYDKEINYLIQGMDNLHRMVAQLQEKSSNDNIEDTEIIETKSKKRG